MLDGLVQMGSSLFGVLFIRVPYYTGNPKRKLKTTHLAVVYIDDL